MGVPFSIVMKVFFLIFLVPFIVAPSMAADFTYKEYSRAPELWKVVSRLFRTFYQATAPVCMTCGW
jgi:hypothetical protein